MDYKTNWERNNYSMISKEKLENICEKIRTGLRNNEQIPNLADEIINVEVTTVNDEDGIVISFNPAKKRIFKIRLMLH